MADVTVTLTEEQAQLVRHFFEGQVRSIEKSFLRTSAEVRENGSLDGRYGPLIKKADQLLIDSYEAALTAFEDILIKFEKVLSKDS